MGFYAIQNALFNAKMDRLLVNTLFFQVVFVVVIKFIKVVAYGIKKYLRKLLIIVRFFF